MKRELPDACTIHLDLRPLPDAVPVEVRLRRVLKGLLRAYGFRCERIGRTDDPRPPTAGPQVDKK